ncbi:MAG TPA: hypothetical protein VGN38_13505 [Caulobacteraceae bacterium]|nr:hypothetical protein [Caulobacteraceae bacterium]
MAGLDLGQIEDVVDQGQQIDSGVMDVAGELHLFVAQIALAVVGQELGQDQQRVEWCAQLVAHVGQEFRLVFRGQRQLLGLLLEGELGLLDLAVLGLHLLVLHRKLGGLFLQLGIGRLQFVLFRAQQLLRLAQRSRLLFEPVVGLGQLALLRLQFAGQQLRLFQQSLGAHVGPDGREDDTDRFHQLIQERALGFVELAEGGQLDHRHHFALEKSR